MGACSNSTVGGNETVADSTSGNSSSSFPADFFTLSQRFDGGLTLHFALAIYACLALVVVCETYFVPSLHAISRRLSLSSDVIGALIMAGGGAIPGLFISIFGTFVTTDDLGLGTIMGSACFNTFVVIGVCAFFAKAGDTLEWWPTTRDFFSFVVTVAVLIGVINNTSIYWYETITMLVIFAIYVIILVYSIQLKVACCAAGRLLLQSARRLRRLPSRWKVDAVRRQFGGGCALGDSSAAAKRNLAALVAFSYGGCGSVAPVSSSSLNTGNGSTVASVVSLEVEETEKGEAELQGLDGAVKLDAARGPPHYEPRWPWEGPVQHSVARTTWWLLNLPLSLLLALTVPDCRRSPVERFFVLTFLLSIAYIGVITYFLTWLIDTIGHTFLVPDAILGVTVLAMGTGLPDLCCSVIVFRQGYCSMAIANGFGSNIIDILISLGVPWCIKTIFVVQSGFIRTRSLGFTYTSCYVMAAIILLYVILALNRFRLDRKVALASLLFYAGFLALALLLELNLNAASRGDAC